MFPSAINLSHRLEAITPPTHQLAGTKRRRDPLDDDELPTPQRSRPPTYSPTVAFQIEAIRALNQQARAREGLERTPLRSRVRHFLGRMAPSTQAAREEEAISRKIAKIMKTFETKPAKTLKRFHKLFYKDGLFQYPVLHQAISTFEQDQEKIEKFYHSLTEKIGHEQSSSLFNELLIKEKHNRTLSLANLSTPPFLVMKSLVSQWLTKLPRSMSRFVNRLDSNLIEKLGSSSNFDNNRGIAEFTNQFLEKVQKWTASTPSHLQEMNSKLNERVSTSLEEAGRDGGFHYALIPLFELVLIPTLKTAVEASPYTPLCKARLAGAADALLRKVKNLPDNPNHYDPETLRTILLQIIQAP